MDKNEFRLKPDFLPFCQARWDGAKYVENTLGEKVQCCLDSCKPSVEYCYKHKDPKDCQAIIRACEDNCLLYQSTSLDSLVDCVSEICGGQGEDCFAKNRDSILKCCRKNCTDCDKECDDYFLSTYMGHTSLRNISLAGSMNKVNLAIKTSLDNNWIYYVIMSIFIIFSGYCLWRMKKLKK